MANNIRVKILWFAIVLFFGLSVSACSAETPITPLPSTALPTLQVTATPQPPTQTAVPPTLTPRPARTLAPTARPLIDPPSAAFPYGVDRKNSLFLVSGEPSTFDPGIWLSSASGMVGNLFSGVVRLDTNLQPIPDLADRWEISPDGKIYTFYLQQGVTFHDGKPFTARDVKYSWERAISPELGSDTALTYLGDIVGVSEVANGEATEISGVRIINDYVIEVTLESPIAYFLPKLSYPVSWIVDEETIDQIEEAPNGTGPFRLVKYDKGEVIVLERNPNYHGGFVSLEYIVFLINPGPAGRLYEAGEIDLIGITDDLLDRATDPGDPLYGNVQSNNGLCTTIVRFDMIQPPFDDLLVRKAFVQAIDKVRYNDILTEGKGVIADGLFPPGLPGYNPDLSPMGFNPENARKSLSESSYGGPEGLPEVVYTIRGYGTGVGKSAAFLVQMWEEVLDVKVVVEQINYRNYLDELFAGNHGQILDGGWCADYPDPENFADLLYHSGSQQNLSNYSNPEVDALLEQARIEFDIQARLALYHQIEQILIDDAAGLFTFHSQAYYLVLKPYVIGYNAAPIGVAQLMNISIVREE